MNQRQSGSQSGIRHYHNGRILDDGGVAATRYQFATGGALPAAGYPQHGQGVPQLHERDQHDVPRGHHGRPVGGALQPAQTNRS